MQNTPFAKNIVDLGRFPSDFLATHYERQLFLATRAVSTSSYDWESFSRDFYAIDPAIGTIKIYAGGVRSMSEYMQGFQGNGAVNFSYKANEFGELLRSGGSLVASRFDKSSLYASKICDEVSNFVRGSVVTTNVYVSKGGNGTFGKHWDTHCVFAVQLIGSKRWKVYKPLIEKPLYFQTSRDHKEDFNAELVFEETLTAGDVLYVPRGWWHEVFPIPNQVSLHLAVGVHPAKVHDFIKWVVMRKLHDHIEFRESLPDAVDNGPALKAANKKLLETLTSADLLREYQEECHRTVLKNPFIDFNDIYKEQINACS